MTFSKHLFFVLFAIATVTAHQLNAMDWQKYCTPVHIPPSQPAVLASDFQIYQFLSAVMHNPDSYLPAEVTHIIVSNAYKITEKLRAECYQKYGECLCSPDSILNFIKGGLNKSIHHMTIVDILKICLSYSNKSLNKIKNTYGHTVFQYFNFSNHTYQQFRQDYVKIICLVAEDQAWNLITERDDNGNTALHYCLEPFISELLNTAPSHQEAWRLINTRNNDGQTALSLAKQYGRKVIENLESYRPKEQ